MLPSKIALLLPLLPFTTAYSDYPALCTAATTNVTAINDAGYMGALTTSLRYTLSPPNNVTTYSPGKSITITLSSENTKVFRGMLLYAATTADAKTHLGHWEKFNDGVFQFMDDTPNSCKEFGVKATLGHKTGQDIELPVTFEWVPPSSPPPGERIDIFAVVVKQRSEGFETIRLSKPLFLEGGNFKADSPEPEANKTTTASTASQAPSSTSYLPVVIAALVGLGASLAIL
ncbi:hypothetical protein HK097_009526 [Rhizophlyctis rosea]|uniref:Reelin domain-containing protein n=1 Tax=Rhizophlyctis rosea TaxID=64517 RepID=A0AAD5X118_9FUNG|nr:hypothetical protein HK097_009526 [Rhizophlyctis rosea]